MTGDPRHAQQQHLAAAGNEVQRLRARVTKLQDALRAIEEHHVALNCQAGRPEEESFTLRTARTALAQP